MRLPTDRSIAGSKERAVRTEVASRYPMVSREELGAGIGAMRADAGAAVRGWIDPRPTVIIVASKPEW